MNNKELVGKLKQKFKNGIVSVREEKRTIGLKKKMTLSYWVEIDSALLHDVIALVCELNYPFFSVITGRDKGQDIELTYHMYLKDKQSSQEEGLHLRVAVPKKKPVLPTITDLIPGALISELEKQEMLGVKIEGIGEDRAFLPKSHPQGNYPWRKENLDRPEPKPAEVKPAEVKPAEVKPPATKPVATKPAVNNKGAK
ncbi:NADH-quinone oxidoreductase subunit C [Candidatus Woesearchaeota archaeon]|nr:NADH-quinone oxidoreductase subunit C [Candidatus Woesearchaeota archaeon]